MTALDIIVLVLMGGAAVLGFTRGFVQEVLSLLVWLLVVLAVRFAHEPLTDFLRAPVGNDGGASVLAFLSIVIVIYALGRWGAKSLGKRSRKSMLGPIDRVLGFGFGMVKGLVVATLGYLLVTLIYDTIYSAEAERPEAFTQSRTYPLLNASGRAIVDFIDTARARDADADAIAEAEE